MMTAGYAAERAFPGSLRHPRLPFTAIAVGGESLAIVLTAVAFRTARRG